MLDHIFDYFFLAAIVFQLLLGIFFYVQNKKIIARFRNSDSREFKNISGKTVSDKGFLRRSFRWCSFNILINQNSVFLFPKDFYFIPGRFINLTFGSNKENTKRPTGLREFSIHKDTVVLVSYPDFLVNGKRTIYLQNLNPEQIELFQKVLKNRMPSALH
ncbi:hypothetical protein CLU96_1616 [Chryseobacterium sp. 52]|uniref:hypothetical protein n=1 Tax=Chryseobacterium sp. 52 TaxID=2035213 RepID=UPI000C17A29A|nr:hypothetical protein [Chryseobacterium sp. 52]PIF44638.1 hypothetical protein CLU96_1616 [Chryseobacterium sp. 52]